MVPLPVVRLVRGGSGVVRMEANMAPDLRKQGSSSLLTREPYVSPVGGRLRSHSLEPLRGGAR